MIKKVDLYQKLNLYRKSWLNSIYFEFFKIIIVRIWIELSRQVDRTAGLGSKKLIKSWFEYNLKQNLAKGRSNRISLYRTNSCILNASIILHQKRWWSWSENIAKLCYLSALDVRHKHWFKLSILCLSTIDWHELGDCFFTNDISPERSQCWKSLP